MRFKWTGDCGVKIPVPGNSFIEFPIGSEKEVPDEVGEKLIGRKGFELVGEEEKKEKFKIKSKFKKKLKLPEEIKEKIGGN